MAAVQWNISMCQNIRIRWKNVYILLFTLSIYSSEIRAIQDGCTLPESCSPGETLPDPYNCSFFYNCSSSGVLEHTECGSGKEGVKKYDVNAQKCRTPSKATCSDPCSEQIPNSTSTHSAPHPDTTTKTVPPAVLDSRIASIDETETAKPENMDLIFSSGSTMDKHESKSVQTTHANLLGMDAMTTASIMNSDDSGADDRNIHNAPTPSGSGYDITEESPDITTQPTTTPTTSPTTPPTTTTETTTPTTTMPTTTMPTTTTTTSMTTKMETTTLELTTTRTTDVPLIPITDPPYVVLTSTPSPTNASVVGPPKDKVGEEGVSVAMIGVVAGVTLLLVVLIVAVVVIVLVVRRRRARRGHDMPKMENPQYATQSDPRGYRFSRDSTLHVGPTVNFQLLNNNGKTSGGDSSAENSLRKKKRPAPVPPSARNQHLLRKKGQAPSPPNPFGLADDFDPDKRVITDIYEVDSHSSKEDLELSTFTSGKKHSVVNDNAITPETRGGGNDAMTGSDNEDTVTEPLLSNNNTKPSVGSVNEEDVVTFAPTSTFKPLDEKKKDLNKSTEVVWDDYDKENNPFFDS